MKATSSSPKAPPRRKLPIVLTVVLLGALGLGLWWAMQALVVERAVGEGRAVADMAENVGRWASQYGGMHVRTQGAQAKVPGSFLTRSVYETADAPAGAASGAAVAERSAERTAMERLEVYYWKNPALIQREVSDVAVGAGSRVPYRMTARTVLNRDNQPTAHELEALDAIQNNAGGERQEYWKIDGGRLLYARAVVAQASCLRCHDTPANAPDFLKTNAQFNGGGGFGYVTGKPAGLISVTVPLPNTLSVLQASVPARAWVALLVGAIAALALCNMALKRQRKRSKPAAF